MHGFRTYSHFEAKSNVWKVATAVSQDKRSAERRYKLGVGGGILFCWISFIQKLSMQQRSYCIY